MYKFKSKQISFSDFGQPVAHLSRIANIDPHTADIGFMDNLGVVDFWNSGICKGYVSGD